MRKTSATIKLAVLVTAGLLAVHAATPALATTTVADTPGTTSLSLTPRAGAASDESRTVSISFPASSEMVTGEPAYARADISTTQPTTVRLQRDVDGTWVDLETAAVTTGGFVRDFAVPTDRTGSFTLRLAVDADAVFPAYTSPSYSYAVTQAPPSGDKIASTVTLTEPGDTAVAAGRALTASGTVGGLDPAGRTVRLELDTRHGWMGVGTATTDATGRYAVAVPTDWYYSGALRATVLGTDTDAAATSTHTFTMRVRPDYTPGGHADQWNAFPGVEHYRWDPCRSYTYKVNLAGAPERALAQVRQAFAQVHAATGLTFVYDGDTSAIPYRTDGRGRKRSGADLTLAFAGDRQVRGLSGNVIGLGGWLNGYDNAIQEGAAVLDRTAHLRSGFGKGATWGSLLLHELGHAMNLDHAAERNEVMHSGLGDFSPGSYQAGDLTGLSRLGAMGGCVGSGATLRRTAAPSWHVAS